VTTFHLIRHGANDLLPRALAGRLPGVHLNAQGRAEAERIAARLKPVPIRHIFSSPMDRARETAEPLARELKLEIEISEAINEADCGEWHGAEMAALERDERWRNWNSFRGGHQLPGGETMIQIQSRIVTEMIRMRDRFAGAELALFTHGDPIRAALCHWLGMPLEFIHRLQVDTGSICVVSLDERTAILRELNAR
jgi:probable phosphoglycerate mutase